MEFSRKEFLRLGLVGGAGFMLPFGASACGSGLTAGNNSAEGSAGKLLKSTARLPEPFSVPLRIPPVLEPMRSDTDADYYEITQRAGQAEILPGLETELWGYNGIFPRPTGWRTANRSGPALAAEHYILWWGIEMRCSVWEATGEELVGSAQLLPCDTLLGI
jgi:spore coat protein A